MLRFLFAGLLALAATACGHMPSARMASLPTPVTTHAKTDLTGAYLSIELRPTQALLETARRLRMQLGFLDMGHAMPARAADEYHVTVAYFRKLSGRSAQKLAETYRHRQVELTVTGWGVAERQSAYFAVSGLEDWRSTIYAMQVDPFTADDAHVTFGVSPQGRRDVHGVAKQAQHALRPLDLVGDVHLKQGNRRIW